MSVQPVALPVERVTVRYTQWAGMLPIVAGVVQILTIPIASTPVPMVLGIGPK